MMMCDKSTALQELAQRAKFWKGSEDLRIGTLVWMSEDSISTAPPTDTEKARK